MRAAPDDWRRMGQERFLRGRRFRRAEYQAPRPSWDHDHCEFCGAKFMEGGLPECLAEGWCSDDDERRWVCPACFEDFAEEFGFEVAEAAGDGSPLNE